MREVEGSQIGYKSMTPHDLVKRTCLNFGLKSEISNMKVIAFHRYDNI